MSTAMNEGAGLRVLHIAPTPFFSDRGCHIRILGMVRGLERNGVHSTLCTYHHGRDVEGVPALRIGDISNYRKTSAGPDPLKYWADVKLYWLALKTARREKPDVLHGHLHEGALLAWMCRVTLFWRQTPVVADIQGSLVGELGTFDYFGKATWVRSMFLAVEKFIDWLPAALTCSSPASYALLRDTFNIAENKLLLAQDGLDESITFVPRKQTDGGEITVIYTGSLLPGKGLGELVEVLETVLKRHDNLRALIVGYPTAEAERRLGDAGVLDRCRLTGQVSYFELPGHLASADIALDPKRGGAGEGSGKAINYMAAGLPVVCFDSDNNRALYSDRDLLATDIADFAERVSSLVNDPGRISRIGEANRQQVGEQHDWGRVAADIRDLYIRLAV